MFDPKHAVVTIDEREFAFRRGVAGWEPVDDGVPPAMGAQIQERLERAASARYMMAWTVMSCFVLLALLFIGNALAGKSGIRDWLFSGTIAALVCAAGVQGARRRAETPLILTLRFECRKCRYSLVGLGPDVAVCPECGQDISDKAVS